MSFPGGSLFFCNCLGSVIRWSLSMAANTDGPQTVAEEEAATWNAMVSGESVCIKVESALLSLAACRGLDDTHPSLD